MHLRDEATSLARLAGALYLAIILIGVLNLVLLETPLIVPDDVQATIQNITASETLYRVGVLANYAMYLLVIILSWALYELVKSQDKGLAVLALALRVAEGTAGSVVVLLSGTAPLLAINGVYSTAGGTSLALVEVLLGLKSAGMDVVLMLLGLGGMLFFYLFFRSRMIPVALAVWGIVTYATMLVVPIAGMLAPDLPEVFSVIFYAPGSLFEIVIGFWLLIRGVRHVPVSATGQP